MLSLGKLLTGVVSIVIVSAGCGERHDSVSVAAESGAVVGAWGDAAPGCGLQSRLIYLGGIENLLSSGEVEIHFVLEVRNRSARTVRIVTGPLKIGLDVGLLVSARLGEPGSEWGSVGDGLRLPRSWKPETAFAPGESVRREFWILFRQPESKQALDTMMKQGAYFRGELIGHQGFKYWAGKVLSGDLEIPYQEPPEPALPRLGSE